jgi:hypothetical protein
MWEMPVRAGARVVRFFAGRVAHAASVEGRTVRTGCGKTATCASSWMATDLTLKVTCRKCRAAESAAGSLPGARVHEREEG